MLLLFLQLSPGMHLIMPHQIELLLPSVPLPLYTLLPCSAYSTIGNDSFSTVSLSRYYCYCLSPSLLLFIQHPLQSQKHALRIYFHIYMYARGGRGEEVEHRGRSSRVCKFFSKNSLRDNGFSMSHTSLPTSRLTSLPRHIQHNSSNLHSHPPFLSSLHGSDNYLHSPNLSPSRCLMFLGHDRWQVSVGVVSCKFFFWVLERASDMF